MLEPNVIVEISDRIATVVLNRPKAMNALNRELVDELTRILERLQEDKDVRCIVLTGNGKAFCAGGDLSHLSQLEDPVIFRQFIVDVGRLALMIMNMEKPVIAMVNGVAAGAGFNLALACDLIVCAQSARFVQSFSKVGLIPDCGGLFLLPRLIGLHKAKELMFTAEAIDATTASNLGLINRVVEDDKLKKEVYELAQKLTISAPISLGFIKKISNRSFELDIETILEREADLQTMCMETQDYKEGVAAFKEKRHPIFKGC
jgi:2-(1,2-epoxy-1,2-dihydrophenyl)acetyl-CoA isomerase